MRFPLCLLLLTAVTTVYKLLSFIFFFLLLYLQKFSIQSAWFVKNLYSSSAACFVIHFFCWFYWICKTLLQYENHFPLKWFRLNESMKLSFKVFGLKASKTCITIYFWFLFSGNRSFQTWLRVRLSGTCVWWTCTRSAVFPPMPVGSSTASSDQERPWAPLKIFLTGN